MNYSSGKTLGELLIDLGWLSHSEIDDALSAAHETGEPLGHVLMLRGKLTAREVQAVVLAQSLLRDRLIDEGEALSALTLCTWSGLSLEDTLLAFWGRYVDQESPCDNRLGQMLIASCCVDSKTIDYTLAYCRKVGLPLGRALTMRKHVTKSLLSAALAAQDLVRCNAISLDLAIGGLAAVNTGMEVSAPAIKEELTLGSLLVHAGVLEHKVLSRALDFANSENIPLGQALLNLNIMGPSLLEAALILQQMLQVGRIRARRAIKALSIAFCTHVSVYDALASITDPPGTGVDISVALFLKHTGLFQPWLGELDSIAQSGLENKDQVQFLSAFVEPEQLAPAVRCTFLIGHGLLSIEQALFGYHCSLLADQDISAFLAEVGWVAPETLAQAVQRRANKAPSMEPEPWPASGMIPSNLNLFVAA